MPPGPKWICGSHRLGRVQFRRGAEAGATVTRGSGPVAGLAGYRQFVQLHGLRQASSSFDPGLPTAAWRTYERPDGRQVQLRLDEWGRFEWREALEAPQPQTRLAEVDLFDGRAALRPLAAVREQVHEPRDDDRKRMGTVYRHDRPHGAPFKRGDVVYYVGKTGVAETGAKLTAGRWGEVVACSSDTVKVLLAGLKKAVACSPHELRRAGRWVAYYIRKCITQGGLAKRAQVVLRYADGADQPQLVVKTFGTEQGALTEETIANIVKIEFDCPMSKEGDVAVMLAKREPKFRELAKYAGATPSEVKAALNAGSFLAKWAQTLPTEPAAKRRRVEFAAQS